MHIVSKRLQWSTARAAAIGGDSLEVPKPRCFRGFKIETYCSRDKNDLQTSCGRIVVCICIYLFMIDVYISIYIHEIFVMYTCMCIHKLISP